MDKKLIRIVQEKINPFLKMLKTKKLFENFDASDWIKEKTEAYQYAQKKLTNDERRVLGTMVHASMLLEA